jgi:hypothetical protein
MVHGRGRIQEVELDSNNQVQAWIECPPRAIPQPGQYLMACQPGDEATPLPTALFMVERAASGFLAAGPLPLNWQPGHELSLRGPFGHGFRLPALARRLALASLSPGASRLLPLLSWAQENNAEAAIFSDAHLPALPAFVELSPLGSLPEALNWADFLALDMPPGMLNVLPQRLDLASGQLPACPGQVLITTDMPCSGLAGCGACAVPIRGRWRLACSEGPVFALSDILA